REGGEHLAEERLELRLGLIDLVHEEDDRRHRENRGQERARRQEPKGEERVLLAGDLGDRVGQGRRVGDQLADALAQELRIEELFGVLPLVERLARVEPLVALETNEPAARDLRQRLRELGLADARRPLDEHGTPHARRQVDDGGDPAARDIARIPETLLDVLHGLEHAGSLLRDEFGFIVADFRPAGSGYNAPCPAHSATIVCGSSLRRRGLPSRSPIRGAWSGPSLRERWRARRLRG